MGIDRLGTNFTRSIVLAKLKCQVARPFTRDTKNPDSSGSRVPLESGFCLSLVKQRATYSIKPSPERLSHFTLFTNFTRLVCNLQVYETLYKTIYWVVTAEARTPSISFKLSRHSSNEAMNFCTPSVACFRVYGKGDKLAE